MKTLRNLILMAIIVLAGCDKEYTADESLGNPELKKAKVPIPLKTESCAVPDMESDLLFLPIPGNDPADPANYITSRMIISGKCTHLGKIDPEKSAYETKVIEFLLEEDKPFLFHSGTGNLTGANGDSFQYTWWAKASLPDFSWVGGIKITGGTGKFEGCSGECMMTGQMDFVNLVNCWTAEGFIVFE